jgi:hypothetical protein
MDASPTVGSYIKFSVTGVSGTVVSAALRLYTASDSTQGFAVRNVPDTTWGERTITYANAPSPSSTITGLSGGFTSKHWVSVDVSSLVQGNGTYTFALTTTTSTSMSLYSRETGSTTAPQLSITSVVTPPANINPPAISGIAQDGQNLSADPGTWSGDAPIAYSYQWLRCTQVQVCASIPNAASPTFTLTSADVGATISVQVTAKNAGGSANATASATSVVAAAPPVNRTRPAISGTPGVGAMLSTGTGVWAGTTPLTFIYQWSRCDATGATCEPIDSATATTYLPTADDAGSTLRATVTASNTAGTMSADSPPTAVVVEPPTNDQPPTISGTAQVGSTLTANPGSWDGSLPMTRAYQWQRCDPNGNACASIPGATSTTYTVVPADGNSTIRVSETAANSGGSSSAVSDPAGPVPAPQSTVIAAAGDIACDPTDSSYNGGLGTTNHCQMKATSNLLVNGNFAAALVLGDLQYGCGGAAAFQQSYDPTWGRVKSITYPAIGNHEYQTSGGTDCDATGHAAGYFNYFGSAAGDPTKGYYSWDIAGWHLIVLNSNCSQAGGCGAGSSQETWLRADLAAHTAACTLAYWHHPRFTSDAFAGNATNMSTVWQDLYNAGADLVLNGHTHEYERFAPQNPAGAADPSRGIREMIVGTGGVNHSSFGTIQPNSEVRDATTFGVLQLTLHPTSYDWKFLPIPGSTFTDSGSTACH